MSKDDEKREELRVVIEKVKELEALAAESFNNQEKSYNLSEDIIVFIESNKAP